jgi:hypothetical protein
MYELHELKQLSKMDSKFLKYHGPEGSQIRHTLSTVKPRKLKLTFSVGFDRSALTSVSALSAGDRSVSRIHFWISLPS